jgi:hypothetical protein
MAAWRTDQLPHVANMPTAATAIAAVANQPRALGKGCSTNWPMTCFREAISMIMTMIGTAATPLMTALQNKALMGIERRKVQNCADKGG